MIMSLKQRKINFKPRIKLDYNIYTSRNYQGNKTMKFSYFFFFFFLGGGGYFGLFVFLGCSFVSFSSSVQLTKVIR